VEAIVAPKNMHEIPEDVPVPHIDHDEHVVFCLIGVDECQSNTAIIVENLPYFERSRQRIDGMLNIAFSGVWPFLDGMGQFVSHDCNVSNRREDSNGQHGIVDEPEVIQKDFESAFGVVRGGLPNIALAGTCPLNRSPKKKPRM
jgi:hypothetical protein